MRFWLRISLSKQYVAQSLLSELSDKGWTLGSIDSLLKRIRKTGTISGNHAAVDRVRRIALEYLVLMQSGGQAEKASISSWVFASNCHLHSSVHRIIHCDLQALVQMLQTMSCSAVVWSQSHLSSHSLINNLIVCNKSCYCSIINCNLNNK